MEPLLRGHPDEMPTPLESPLDNVNLNINYPDHIVFQCWRWTISLILDTGGSYCPPECNLHYSCIARYCQQTLSCI